MCHGGERVCNASALHSFAPPDEVEEEEQVEEKRENDELPTHTTPKLNSLQPLPPTPIATTSRVLCDVVGICTRIYIK
ncbi:hypothetical protein Pcinc_001285 [Petrolisthes cinctipes]|uniref:Uncharacterized protein n=1 Tax=Petrolisthes cinctipes TaxID=88211 RepID=A0AAE1GN42_PETCI|nr:hypothetical protein Pcinc_001285 [Petrolisthes cinctipes]